MANAINAISASGWGGVGAFGNRRKKTTGGIHRNMFIAGESLRTGKLAIKVEGEFKHHKSTVKDPEGNTSLSKSRKKKRKNATGDSKMRKGEILLCSRNQTSQC